MFLDGFIPFNLIEEVSRGLVEPGLVYTERMQNISSGEGGGSVSRLINLLSIFFLFFKLLFIFYFVYFWNKLSPFRKLICFFYCIFFISPGIASGTNSVVFQLMIFLSSTLLVVVYIKRSKWFVPMLSFSALMAFAAILSFGFIMSQRGGGFHYFASTSPLSDVSVVMNTPDLDSFTGYVAYAAGWLNYYLVQGYYGFSLVMDVDWSWTYGFGNSEFMQRQFLLVSGIDVSEITYQAKVSHIWDKSAQWHSFYGQFANDFGLLGLPVFLFGLGFLLARAWCSVLYSNSFYGAALMPIFVIMFIFFPANNQVFAYIDTLSYFIVISLLWFFNTKKLRFI